MKSRGNLIHRNSFRLVQHVLFTVLVALLAAGCGGTGPQSPFKTSCTITLSGGMSGSYTCNPAIVYDTGKQQFQFGATTQDDPGVPQTIFTMTSTDQPRTGSFDAASGSHLAAETGRDASTVWKFDTQAPLGSGSLTITGLQAYEQSNGVTMFYGSGSATATLAPVSGTAGTVTVIITFSMEPVASATPTGGILSQLGQVVANLAGTARQETPVAVSNLAGFQTTATPTQATATPVQATLAAPTLAAPQGTCQISLSGSVNKQLACTVQMVYTAKDGNTGIEIASVNHIGNLAEVSLVVTLSGEPKAAPVTYGWDNSSNQGAIVYEGGLQVFSAASKDKKGSSSLTLSSLEVTSTAADGGKVYAAHGSAQAQLSGPVGAEQVSISF